MPAGAGIRVDTGVAEGDAVTPFYDSMIAKIIAHAGTREAAIARLGAALAETEVEGVATNLAALRAIVAHPGFARGVPTTGFLREHEAALLAPPPPPPPRALLAAIAALLHDEARGEVAGPWGRRDGWRLVGEARRMVRLRTDESRIVADVVYTPGPWRVTLDGESHLVSAQDAGDAVQVRIDDLTLRARAFREGGAITVTLPGTLPGEGSWRIGIEDALAPREGDSAGDDRIASPIPGRIAAVLCAPGQAVTRGQVLVVVEAMKTELRISAPLDGVVARVDVAVGDQVGEGEELVALAPPDEGATASAPG
jgi:3-methylcrotonyl-CoA carboxylase alpha subunit